MQSKTITHKSLTRAQLILHRAGAIVNSGRTLYEVQSILGHSDAKVTQRYAHLSTKSMQEAANSASVIIKGAILSGEVQSAASA